MNKEKKKLRRKRFRKILRRKKIDVLRFGDTDLSFVSFVEK